MAREIPPTVAITIKAKGQRDPETGCIVWLGYTDRLGYGHVGGFGAGKTKLAHRVSYELAKGPIPDGLSLDHLCRNRGCINPDHLEPVTHAENVRRGQSFAAKNAAKTHCVWGHEFTPENTYLCKGSRICRACTNRRLAEREAQLRSGERKRPSRARRRRDAEVEAFGAVICNERALRAAQAQKAA